MWVPGSLTEGESFLWYRPEPRLQLGVAYLWEQKAFRVLGNFVLIEETPTAPNLKVGFGIQSITTGNPGYFATTEKNFHFKEGRLNLYAGIGFRSNESHSHAVAGVKLHPHGPWAVGIQLDGHETHPYLVYDAGPWVAGFYWANTERAGWLLGLRW